MSDAMNRFTFYPQISNKHVPTEILKVIKEISAISTCLTLKT